MRQLLTRWDTSSPWLFPVIEVCILSSAAGSDSPTARRYILGLVFPCHSSSSPILFMALSHSNHGKSVCSVHN